MKRVDKRSKRLLEQANLISGIDFQLGGDFEVRPHASILFEYKGVATLTEEEKVGESMALDSA